MDILKIIFVALLCVPVAYAAFMVISKLMDDVLKNKK